ncbi:MAG: METTL5 family protein [Candidatus Hodarchaeota archaeon]
MYHTVKSKKQLEIILQDLNLHPTPKPSLEQYPIDAKTAANVLYFASFTNNDIFDKIVLDLGCGTGRLAIGASLLGAKKVFGVDVDSVAIEIARKNANKSGCKNIEWVEQEISQSTIKADTIIQNPPFGVQTRGQDVIFLKKAMELGGIIYSLHKSGDKNRVFLKKTIRELGGKIDSIIEMELSIPHQFHFHSKKIHKVKVDLWRIVK